MESGLSYQQKMVWDRLHRGMELINDANSSLESKATVMVAASATAATIATGSRLFPGTFASASGTDVVFLVAFSTLSLIMIQFATKVWGPASFAVPGGSNVSHLYGKFIAQDRDTAFNNGLMDAAKAYEHAVWANKIKGDEVRKMLRVAQCQIGVLVVGVVASCVMRSTLAA